MKKQIPYLVALFWMIAVAFLAFFDGLTWSSERKRSSYLDGCTAGEKTYLVENTEDEGILYVMDAKGRTKEVSLSSAVKPDHVFARIDYEDGLYAVLIKKEEPTHITIVQYDDQGRFLAKSPEFYIEEKGRLTGFCVQEQGFYLTTVQEGQQSAAAYFVDKQELEEKDKTNEPVILSAAQLASSEPGRRITEAR